MRTLLGRSLVLALLTGCAAARPARATGEPVCRPLPGVAVINEAGLPCEEVARAYELAAQVAERYGVLSRERFGAVATRVTHLILDEPRLYRNRRGNEVAGTFDCDGGRMPVLTVDKTLQGLLHEMLHAEDCLRGSQVLAEPTGSAEEAWKVYFWSV